MLQTRRAKWEKRENDENNENKYNIQLKDLKIPLDHPKQFYSIVCY